MGQLKKTNIYITGNRPPMENVVFGSPLTVTTRITDSEENKKHTWYELTTPNPSSGNIHSYRSAKIEFTTTEDNIEVEFKIKAHTNWDGSVTISALDYYTNGAIDADYNIATIYGNLTEKIIKYQVPTKGKHFIQFEYSKGSNNSGDGAYICAWSNLNMPISEVKSVYVENSKIQQMNVQGKNLFEYELGNTISWETLQWTKSSNNNSYTYNTKEKLKIGYNNKYAYLTNPPASMDNGIYQLKFYNINDYHDYGPYSTYNCTYKLDLSDLNTSNITNMGSMFYGCTVLTSLNLSDFGTSKVTSMDNMFNGCKSLTSLDLSGLDTSKVTNMNSMFYRCESLTSLDLSGLDTSKVTNAKGMFSGCKSLTSLDLSSLDISNILNVFDSSNGGMFENCEKLVDLKLPKNFITSKITNISQMFKGCKSLTSLDLSGWDTSNIEYMNDLFVGCGIKIIDLSNWDFSNLNITNKQFGWMFRNANCETIILPNIKKYKNLNKCAFYNIYNLKYFYANELVNSNVFDIVSLFAGDSNLISLDMTDWDFSNITNASSMFYNCSSLTTLINEHEHEPDVIAFKEMKISIDLHYCTKLNYESVYALFRGVATITTTKTITLPKVMEGNLDATKVKIATDKGWTVAYK